jgi:nucleotide-binding universal stress UspA family protein
MKRNNNNNILVPTDFSEVAQNALGHALKIADVYKNEITLINIQDDGGLFGLFGANNDKMGLIKEAIDMKMDKLISESRVLYPHIVINKRVEYGKIYKVITEIAEEENFDSIIMGTNGASGLQQITGSNASRVINYAKVPVVVVKDKPIGKNGYEKIVLPIDLSRESRQKVTWAIHLAKKFNSITHVIYENSTRDEVKNRIYAAVNQTQDILSQNNANYIVRGLDEDKYPDSFAEDTLAYANEIGADLIMIMTQQEKGFSEFLLGSYAQQIVNHSSQVPVMCINSSDTGIILDGVFGS